MQLKTIEEICFFSNIEVIASLVIKIYYQIVLRSTKAKMDQVLMNNNIGCIKSIYQSLDSGIWSFIHSWKNPKMDIVNFGGKSASVLKALSP